MRHFLIVKSTWQGSITGDYPDTKIMKASSKQWALKKILIKYPNYYLDHELTPEEVNQLT